MEDDADVIMVPPGQQRIELKTVPNNNNVIFEAGLERIDNWKRYGALTDVTTIPNSVTLIDNSAFSQCKSLTSIDIPDSVTSIGNEAFYRCLSLSKVTIPHSVAYIGQKAFVGCKSLEAIVIPEGLTKIEQGTFINCHSLERIELPNSITEIDDRACAFCSSLQNIDIPKGVATIGEWAFQSSGLEKIIIPDGIEIIPKGAFYGCRSLRTVQFPASVKTICQLALFGCYNLENLIIPNGLPALKELNLDDYKFGVHGWYLISQLVANSPNLEALSLKNVCSRRAQYNRFLDDDDGILAVLELASSCPSLRSIACSLFYYTPKILETLAKYKDIPQHLRLLSIDGKTSNEVFPATHLLSVLKNNPNLVVETIKFWDDSEDSNVQHHLDMNRYGCRGFNVPDSLWPILIERLDAINTKRRIDSGAANILYHLLHRHSELLASISGGINTNGEVIGEINQLV